MDIKKISTAQFNLLSILNWLSWEEVASITPEK